MEVNIKQAFVEVKKVKLTKSILNQSQWVSFKDIQLSNLLGWCVEGKLKYVVSYDTELNVVKKSLFFTKCVLSEITKENLGSYLIEIGNDPSDLYNIDYENDPLLGTYKVYLTTYGKVERTDFDDLEAAQMFYNKAESYRIKVNQLGQFYL